MLHVCRMTQVAWAISDAELDGCSHFFKFDLRKGQCEVKLGQIRPKFQTQNFVSKVYLSCPFIL